jgi:hypothetical protein
MHQQARLTTPFPVAGKNVGDLVGIEDVERCFTASSDANAALSFVCAESRCAVPVSAVITAVVKVGRKTSPSSYFRSGRTLKHLCGRLPVAPQHGNESDSGHLSANPTRSTSPTLWIDPRTVSQSEEDNGAGSSDDEANSSDGGSKRQSTGEGTSQGRSQRVEKFAKEWQAKTDFERKSTALSALWNPGGSYHSAFRLVEQLTDMVGSREMIMVGKVKSVEIYATGYAVELAQRSAKGCALHLWIPDQCLISHAAGHELRRQLVSAAKNRERIAGHEIFALGTFGKKTVAGVAIMSLTVPHPHMMWIA